MPDIDDEIDAPDQTVADVGEVEAAATVRVPLPPSPLRLLGTGLIVLVVVVFGVLIIGSITRESGTSPTVGTPETRAASARIERLLSSISSYTVSRLPVETETQLARTVAGVNEEMAFVRVTRVLSEGERGVAIVHLFAVKPGQETAFNQAAAGTATTREVSVAGRPAVLTDNGQGQISLVFVENGVGVILQGSEEEAATIVAGEAPSPYGTGSSATTPAACCSADRLSGVTTDRCTTWCSPTTVGSWQRPPTTATTRPSGTPVRDTCSTGTSLADPSRLPSPPTTAASSPPGAPASCRPGTSPASAGIWRWARTPAPSREYRVSLLAPDGHTLARVRSGTLWFEDSRTGRRLAEPVPTRDEDLFWSRDSRWLLSLGLTYNVVSVWDASDGSVAARRRFEGDPVVTFGRRTGLVHVYDGTRLHTLTTESLRPANAPVPIEGERPLALVAIPSTGRSSSSTGVGWSSAWTRDRARAWTPQRQDLSLRTQRA